MVTPEGEELAHGQREWWQDFFSGPALDFVQRSRDDETTLEEVDFIEEALAAGRSSQSAARAPRILDVPCGAGRIALELAARGYRVTGVDLAPSLLEEARRRAEARQLAPTWERRDMRDLPWRAEFDAALCWWSSFGYFDEAGNLEFLKAVSRALKPGAGFILDTPLIETRLPEMMAEERVWWPVGDLLALEDRAFDHETSRVESRWSFVNDGRVERRHLSLRLYTYRELAHLLERAGFGDLRPFGSLDREPFELGAPWLYLVCRKVAEPR